MRAVLLAAAVVAITGVASDTHARCRGPHAFTAPAGGYVTGPEVHVYAFVPARSRAEPVVVDPTKSFEVDIAIASETAGLRVYDIRLRQRGDTSSFFVKLDGKKIPFSYGSLAAKKRTAATAISASHESSRWTCSHTDVRHIELSGPAADAYRVERADDLNELAAGNGTVTIQPATTGGFWDDRKQAPRPARATLALGHVSCFGETAPVSQGLFYMRVTPLWSDGAGPRSQFFAVERDTVYPVSPVAPTPIADAEPLEDSPPSADRLDHTSPPAVAATARPPATCGSQRLLVVSLALLALAVLALVLFRRRRLWALSRDVLHGAFGRKAD